MKKVFILSLFVLSIACNKSDDHKNDDGKLTHSDSSQQKDITDYSACEHGTAPDDIRGAWLQSQENQGMETHL